MGENLLRYKIMKYQIKYSTCFGNDCLGISAILFRTAGVFPTSKELNVSEELDNCLMRRATFSTLDEVMFY